MWYPPCIIPGSNRYQSLTLLLGKHLESCIAIAVVTIILLHKYCIKLTTKLQSESEQGRDLAYYIIHRVFEGASTSMTEDIKFLC